MSDHPYRTHTCGQLREPDAGQSVRLSGFVHSSRVYKNQVFVDVRDHYGITQLVFEGDELMARSKALKAESVITVDGQVKVRESKNPKLPTGDVEIEVTQLSLESERLPSELPIQVLVKSDRKDEEERSGEELRMRWRFLDLRRPRLQRNIVVRDLIVRGIREHMAQEGFLEINTPILTNSSPEGARDYLVPSRLHPGKFYALPQAPQQWKQILMGSGFDKYFQIAPCFRDEDARADRAPGEFYQLDMEMAFATQEDVFQVIERMYKHLAETIEVPSLEPGEPASKRQIVEYPFPRIPYWEAIDRYGSDKPDLRNPLPELVDVTEAFRGSKFSLFGNAVANGGQVKAFRLPAGAKQGKGLARKLEKLVKERGFGGLPHLIYEDEGVDGTIKKPTSPEEHEAVKQATGAEPGDLVMFGFGPRAEAAAVLGVVREHLARDRELTDPNQLAFAFIVDFPFYELAEDEEGEAAVDFSHNPFSMPQCGIDELTVENHANVLAYQYDICCNGIELSSGAIRNHKPEVMYRAFEVVGYSKEEVDREFGHMIQIFSHGCPPHGGMAPGIERTVMIWLDEPNIREVVAFPKNQRCQDLLVGAPSDVRPEQLEELHLEVQLPAEPAE